MSLARSIEAAQEAKKKLDPLLAPAQKAWDDLKWATDQLAGLQQAAEEDAKRFQKATQEAVEAAERVAKAAEEAAKAALAVAPIVAAWADYLVQVVGPLGVNLANWTYDDSSAKNPYTEADDHIVNPANKIYAKADDAGKKTLDGILDGVRRVKQSCEDLKNKKEDWEHHHTEHKLFGKSDKLAYLIIEAAKLSLPG